MYKKTLIFLLVFTIIFNFAFLPKKVNAEVLTMSAGLYVFLKAAMAAGLTYVVADKVTKEGMELYNQWMKFNNNQPPDDPDDPKDPDLKSIIASLLGVGIATNWKGLVDNVKDFFVSIGAKPGSNDYLVSGITHLPVKFNERYEIKEEFYLAPGASKIYSMLDKHVIFYNNGRYLDIVNGDRVFTNVTGWPMGGNPSESNIYIDYAFYTRTSYEYRCTIYGAVIWTDKYGDRKQSSFHTIMYPTKPGDSDINEYGAINYVINNNSYITTNNPENISPVYPTIDVFPKEKVEKIVTPYGYYDRYVGDDLVNDYINSISSPNDLTVKTPGHFVETDYGTIFVPEGKPVPGPKPVPDPKPDPTPDPTPNPTPDPKPEPYPDPQPEGDVEVKKGLGNIIDLLKELINKNNEILNKVPDNTQNNNPGLFEIPKDVHLDFEPLQNLTLSDKFPFCLPWDLKNSISLLVSPGEAPKWKVPIHEKYITIDLSEFESLALISRSFFSLLFVIAMVVITRQFIGGA